MNRVLDALVTAATADIARHRLAYLIVRGFWIIYQQRRCLHDLADLAKAALRDIELAPSLLHRVIAGRMKTFDRRDLPADHIGYRGDAGANVACLSTITVQAPQSAWPQPYLVPVKPVSSRRNHSSGRSGSPSQLCCWPLIFTVIMIVPRSS